LLTPKAAAVAASEAADDLTRAPQNDRLRDYVQHLSSKPQVVPTLTHKT